MNSLRLTSSTRPHHERVRSPLRLRGYLWDRDRRNVHRRPDRGRREAEGGPDPPRRERHRLSIRSAPSRERIAGDCRCRGPTRGNSLGSWGRVRIGDRPGRGQRSHESGCGNKSTTYNHAVSSSIAGRLRASRQAVGCDGIAPRVPNQITLECGHHSWRSAARPRHHRTARPSPTTSRADGVFASPFQRNCPTRKEHV
jgi:hypothetical protein